MAAASQGVTRDQLVWTQDAYIRDDTYRAALATIINALHRLPIAAVWGGGTTSSSDGQFFRGGKRGASGGDINTRYGVDPGFSFYTHVSDQHGPYHVKVISAATFAEKRRDRLIGGGMFNWDQPAIGKVAQSGTEAEAEHGAEREHMVSRAAGIGKMFRNREIAAVMQQAVENIRRVRADVIREH